MWNQYMWWILGIVGIALLAAAASLAPPWTGPHRAADTGLGFDRSDKVVVIQVISRPRKKQEKVGSVKTCAISSRRRAASPAPT
jgi:hypothetical protein